MIDLQLDLVSLAQDSTFFTFHCGCMTVFYEKGLENAFCHEHEKDLDLCWKIIYDWEKIR